MAKKEENAEQLTPQQQKMKALQAAMAKIEKDLAKAAS
jgi:recombination protein RecA